MAKSRLPATSIDSVLVLKCRIIEMFLRHKRFGRGQCSMKTLDQMDPICLVRILLLVSCMRGAFLAFK